MCSKGKLSEPFGVHSMGVLSEDGTIEYQQETVDIGTCLE
jgi:hypothetical protein